LKYKAVYIAVLVILAVEAGVENLYCDAITKRAFHAANRASIKLLTVAPLCVHVSSTLAVAHSNWAFNAAIYAAMLTLLM
jgi:hypothetical protein